MILDIFAAFIMVVVSNLILKLNIDRLKIYFLIFASAVLIIYMYNDY